MDERVIQFRVGVMVFATVIITAILLVLFEEVPGFVTDLFRRTYTVRLWFPEARGVDQDTLVRRNGLLVGRVKEVRFPRAEEREELLGYRITDAGSG